MFLLDLMVMDLDELDIKSIVKSLTGILPVLVNCERYCCSIPLWHLPHNHSRRRERKKLYNKCAIEYVCVLGDGH